MMDWLTEWLKQVILVILLAAFVDLLLPNQTMQRYVKTVVSLFILMVLLTPVFELFQRGWNVDRLMAQAEQVRTDSSLLASAGKAPTLEAILAQSRKLSADNGEQARQLAETRLSAEMKAGLERATGSEVAELAARINVDDQGNPAIVSVRAVLLHKQAPEVKAAEPSARPIGQVLVEPVKPVSIGVSQAPEDAKAAAAEVRNGPDSLRTGAEAYFRDMWQLPPERVTLQVGS